MFRGGLQILCPSGFKSKCRRRPGAINWLAVAMIECYFWRAYDRLTKKKNKQI